MMLSDLVKQYLELERKLFVQRAKESGDTSEEDAIMDSMEEIWWQLGDEETHWLDTRPRDTFGAGFALWDRDESPTT
jgi:hypothetical protein